MRDADYIQVKRRVKAVKIGDLIQLLSGKDKDVPKWLTSIRSLKFHRRSTIVFAHKPGVLLEVKHDYYLQLSNSKEPVQVAPQDYLVGVPVGSGGYRLEPWTLDKFTRTFVCAA